MSTFLHFKGLKIIMIKTVLTSFGKKSGSLTILGLLTLGYIILQEFEIAFATEPLVNGSLFYSVNFHIFWIVSYLFTFAGLFSVLIQLRYEKGALSAQAWLGFIFVALFIVLVFASIVKLNVEPSSGMSTLIVGVIVLLTTGLGWVISHQSEQIKHRTSHTYKILLDSRLSNTFQDKVNDMIAKYPPGKLIDETSITEYMNKAGMDEATFKAINGSIYILDFYEFIASGVKSGDLDDDFLYENARGFVCGMWVKAEKIIKIVRGQNQPKSWIQLEELVTRWEGKYDEDPARFPKRKQSKK